MSSRRSPCSSSPRSVLSSVEAMAQRDRRPAQRRVLYPAPRQLFEMDNRDTITCENLCRATYEPVVSNVVYFEIVSGVVHGFGVEALFSAMWDTSGHLSCADLRWRPGRPETGLLVSRLARVIGLAQ